ncbi:hypothetical protein ACFU5O_09560 [Streptomyces sp. NPDC057445]|uniref:hypothetical protein n=1 Tax=Streptomyces sp. NPDC057445 TaxID=3346136 RepID=UPI0036C35B0C
MADERYEWLDEETAERLLRGEPVEPVGVDARSDAQSLSEVLDSARVREAGTESLRGEEAALAAFRKARDGGAAELLPPVRLTAPAPRPARWARPLRWGLAASLAGFAVGGVAVAAVAGALPTPFGDDRAPMPASTVSAAVPGPVVSDSPTGGNDTTPLPSSPTGGGNPVPPPSSGTRGSTGGQGGDRATPGGPAQGGEPGESKGKDSYGHGDRYRRTVDACRDYRSGQLDEERKRRLEDVARGADRIKRFCDRVLSGAGRSSSGGDQDGGDGDGGDDGSGGDGNDQGGDDGEDGAPAVPGFPTNPAPAPVIGLPVLSVAGIPLSG